MTDKFCDGQKLKRLVFSNNEVLVIGAGPVGDCITDIRVSMENGQIAPVPWFVVTWNSGKTQKWNGALVEGVTF